MPNRILKESICTSENIQKLSPFEEITFYRLIVNCDDYGRMDARPKILIAKLFPLRNVREDQIVKAMRSLASAELVSPYEVDGRPFVQIVTWSDHQQIRAKRSKYPAPDSICNQMISDDSICPRNPIQSESNPNTESESIICSEPEPVSDPAIITLRLNDGSEFPVLDSQVSEWRSLYPAVDVLQELRNMKGWCEANPTKRKTKSGILRFVNAWLAKEQDRGGKQTAKPAKGHFIGERKDDLDAAALDNVLVRMFG